MKINSSNNVSFKSKFEKSSALVELVGKLPQAQRERAYVLLTSPTTKRRLREIKIDDSEPVVKVVYSRKGRELNDLFRLHLAHDGINSNVKLQLKGQTAEDLLESIFGAISEASSQLKNSFEYIKKRTSTSVDFLND